MVGEAVVAESGVTPFNKPAGRALLAAVVLNKLASKLALRSSRTKTVITLTPSLCRASSPVAETSSANLWTGPNVGLSSEYCRAGIGAPGATHATSLAAL